jgi:hypothetical protein
MLLLHYTTLSLVLLALNILPTSADLKSFYSKEASKATSALVTAETKISTIASDLVSDFETFEGDVESEVKTELQNIQEGIIAQFVIQHEACVYLYKALEASGTNKSLTILQNTTN